MLKLGQRRCEVGDAAVEDNRPVGVSAFERVHKRIVERRDRPVVLGAQAVEPGFARVDYERRRIGRLYRFREVDERLARLLLVDADAAFDGHRNVDRRHHSRDGVGDQPRFAHQAGPEPAALHSVGWAAAIEIDFVIAKLSADPGRFGEPRGIRAAELQRNRTLLGREADQAFARPEHDRVGRHHLGIKPGPAREPPVKRPAAPIGPIHHRRHGKSKGLI
jgi:hypothetical protein